MKKTKFFAVVMAAVMTLSMVACGEKTDNEVTPTAAPTTAPTEAPADPTATPVPAPQNVTIADASVTFEDGNMGFVAPYLYHARSANVELSIADYNGSKALKVVNLTGGSKVPFLAIDVSSLLGANVTKLAGVDLVIGTSYEDGSFHSTSGKILSWFGTELTEGNLGSWSVYMEKKNPKITTGKVAAGNEFVADAGNILLISLETDNGFSEEGLTATFYVDDIRFFDAAGNTLTADTTVAFVEPEGFVKEGHDANLLYVNNQVALDGFAVSADGWVQAGIDLTDEQRALIKPGCVIEVAYECTDPVWLIAIGENPLGGWLRGVDQNDFIVDGYVSTDNAIVQYTYEQLAAYWGDGFEQYLTTLQCEGKSAWKVHSVTIGEGTNYRTLGSKTAFDGFAVSADGWVQAGIDLTDEQRALFKPGCVVEIAYECADPVWMIAIGENPLGGWLRAVDQNDYIVDGAVSADNTVVQYTYEQLAAYWGDGFEQYLTTLQCEGKSAWKVHSVTIGTPMYPQTNVTNLDGFTVSADGWVQAGIDLTEEQRALLVPGSVVTIQYKCSDPVWLIAIGENPLGGWLRAVDQNTYIVDGAVSEDGTTVQYTYEQLAKYWGEDFGQYVATLQCEGKSAWEVYSVTVGMAPTVAGAEAGGATETVKPADPTIQVADGTVEFTNSLTFADSAWWTQMNLLQADLIGDLDPANVTAIKFTCPDTNFIVGYTDVNTAAWAQFDTSNTYVVKTADFNKTGEDPVVCLYLSKGDGVEYTITWEVYTGGSTEIIVPEEPAEPVVTPATDTIDGTVGYTGSLTFADSAWWTQMNLLQADLIGDLDPATVKGVKFTSDTTFIVGWTDAATTTWQQPTDSTVYVAKNIDFNKTGEDPVVCLYLSKGDGVEYTINWEVYLKDETDDDVPAVEEPATDPLAAEYAGDYGVGFSVAVGDLAAIGGDVTVTFDVATMTSYPYWQLTFIDYSDGWNKLTADDFVGTAPTINDWGFIELAADTTTMTVTISKAAVDRIVANGGGLATQVYGVVLKNVTVAAAEAAGTETPAADAVTGDFSGKYVGDYSAEWIPASAFAACTDGATVTINYTLQTEGRANQWWNLTFIKSDWSKYLDPSYYIGTVPAFSEYEFVAMEGTSYTFTLSADALAQIKADGQFGIQTDGVIFNSYSVTPAK